MMTLKRWKRSIWRSREKEDGEDLLPTYDDFQPLETHEQEEMVQRFEKNHATLDIVWRGIFSALLSSFSGFFIYSALRQAIYPWDMRFHAYFMEEVDSMTVIFAVTIFSTTMLGLLWKSKWHIYWLWSSFVIGLLLAFFWLNHMFRLPKFHWDVIWLPLGPFGCAGVCLYVDQLLLETLDDIKQLRSSIYHFKRC